MTVEFLTAGPGLVILLIAGDTLVKGAVNLSLRLGLPALIVSLTVVAFGTSAPELLIAIDSVLEDVPGLALGNVVGSNTANVLMVLGVPAILATMHTSMCNSRRDYLIMIASTVLFIGLCFTGTLTWIHGLILLAALFIILGRSFREAMAHRAAGKEAEEEEVEGADANLPGWRIALYLVLGLIGLPVGADLLVKSSVTIAEAYNVSDTVIGLTLVAIGTSLPELATTVMAALRRHADVALGNVIGSNMFNLLAITGIATLVGPIPVPPEFLRFDLWVMLAASLIMIPFVFMRQDITRIWGIGLTAIYGAYLVFVLI